MDKELTGFLMAAILIAGTLLIAWAGGFMSSYDVEGLIGSEYSAADSFSSVSELIGNYPVGKQVSVNGTVDQVLADYTSKKGYVYQRFYITDGKEEVLAFCMVEGKRIDVEVGNVISIAGKFQEYYGKPEIGYCSRVRVVG